MNNHGCQQDVISEHWKKFLLLLTVSEFLLVILKLAIYFQGLNGDNKNCLQVTDIQVKLACPQVKMYLTTLQN